MKRNGLYTAICAVVMLMLAACARDTIKKTPDSHIDGKYPLEIGSVTLSAEVSEQPWGSSQLRVTENPDDNSSMWEVNETIHVKLGDEQTTYTVNTDGGLTLSGNQLYWKKTTDNIIAWYVSSEATDGSINLQDQSSKLAYVLRAELPNHNYTDPVTLDFKHQLAKVRVELDGDNAGDVTTVSIKSYTTCENNYGTVRNGANEGEIIMHKVDDNTYEANVVPDYKIDKIKVNSDENWTILSTSVTPVAGAVNTINITVKPREIDLSTYTGTTLTVSGETIIKGGGNAPKNLQIIVESGSDVTLENVNLTYNEGPTIICQGTATITLKGDNKLAPKSKGVNQSLDTSGSGIEMRSSGTLTIESEPNATLAIEKTRTEGPGITPYFGAGIGLYDNANLVIKGGTITVTGGQDTSTGGADIGGCAIKRAGTITIESGTFTLSGRCMNNSLIGKGTYGSCGTVTIRKGVTVNGTTYAQDHIGEIQ